MTPSILQSITIDSASGIFGVLFVVFGGACVLLLVSTKTLRDSRDDQEKRIDFLEKEGKRQQETISGLIGERDALRRVVTGEVHLVAISDLLTQHHTEAVQQWIGMDETLLHIDETLTGFPTEVTKAIAAAFAAGREQGEKT